MVAYSDQGYGEVLDQARTPAVSFRDVIFSLRRHRRLILACATLGSLVGTCVLMILPPTYTAETSIVLDARRPRVVDLPSIVAEQTTNPEAAQLRSEVDILQSDDLAGRVIARLGLLQNPSFQQRPSLLSVVTSEAKKHILERFPRLVAWVPMLRATSAAAGRSTGAEQTAFANAIQAYKANLGVVNDGRSYVIRLTYRSPDPQLAARIVNTHVQLYLSDQVAYKQEIGKQATAWLTRELSNLQMKLRTSEEAVQRFREENQIVQSGDTTLLNQQLAAVNAQLPAAAAERAAQESRLKHARELLQRGSTDTETNVLDSPLIQRLREEEAAVLRRQAELRTLYGDHHPSILRVDAELRDLRASIRLAVGRIIKSIENDVQIARTKEEEVRARLVELERRSVIAERAQAKLRDLQREVAANTSLIDVLLNRYKQVSAQEEIQQPDARVVSLATAPISPSFPKLRTHVPIILAASFFISIGLAFVKDLMSRGFKGSHEIEVECELPNLGSVPMVPRAWPRVAAPHDLVIDHPRSSFAEAIRYIRNSIQVTSLTRDSVPKTVLITSSLPQEGKSILALSLARSFAQAGRRTLIIDCDLRNPSIGRMVGCQTPAGDLSRVLSREIHWQDAICTDAKSALQFMGAETAMFAPNDLVSSFAMRDLIDQCRQHYDIVILDSPPITAVSDALTLSRWVDATMLVVRWGVTPREIAKTSLHKLFQNGARLCGAVLTQVDMQRGVFSPAELEYYHKHNRAYYVQ
jgi:succinoglycan biosynthesis transport protein ExoP